MKTHKLSNQIDIYKYENQESVLTLNTIIETLGMIVESGSIDGAIGKMFEKMVDYIGFEKGVLLIKKDGYFETNNSVGLKQKISSKKLLQSDSSLVYCIGDIGSSLIVHDIQKDKRFNENELFEINKSTSVVARCIILNKSIYGIMLFYDKKKDKIQLPPVFGMLTS